jgi:hypothetical protein
MKPFAYFLCALAILLVALSPWLILSYYEKLPEEPYYEGILQLWHISGWRTGGSSAAAFLEGRIRQYEAGNPHVFVELTCLTPEKAAKALRDGETPDLVSFPYGEAPALTLAPLPGQSFVLLGDSKDAWPYMFGGYCLLVNNDLLGENGVDVPQGWGIRPDALLEAAQLGVVFDAEDGFSALPALALHTYPEAEGLNMSTWGEPEPPDAALALSPAAYTDGLDAFCKGEAAVLIASHRQLFDIAERYTQGEAPAFTAYAVGGYTDMAQMVGVAAQEDALKQAACESFAAYLTGSSSQKKLEALGVLPAVKGVDIYAENDALRAMYERLCDSGVFAPPEERQTLDALSMEAYGGSAAAFRDLRSLLNRPS